MARLRKDVVTETAGAHPHGDVSTEMIARRAGVQTSTLNRLFNGSCTPSLNTLLALKRTYGLSLDRLVDDEETGPAVTA